MMLPPILRARLINVLNPLRNMRSLAAIITVTPSLGLIDDPLDIKVSGLQPGQKVTLQTYLEDYKLKFISCGQYLANDSGLVVVAEQACLGGCYTGVESTGLIWSMEQAPGQREGLRLMKKDAKLPYDVHLYVHDGHINLDSCYERQKSDSVLASGVFNRTYKHPDVQRMQIKDGRLRGALYTPPGPGPFPVVMDLFGTAGGLIETRAALLASHGFQVLALAYFAYDDLQQYLSVVDMDYFEEGVEFLMSLPTYNGRGVGVVGVSKGAEIALAMAELMPKVKAVVSINGLYFRSSTPCTYRNQEVGHYSPDYSKVRLEDNALILVDCFDKNQMVVPEEAVIKVEKSNAEFLFLTSGDDGQVPPWTTGICADRLRAAGKSNYQFIVYEGAGHLLEAPHSPFCKASYHSKFGCSFLWGGNMIKHTRAQEDAWPRILNFFCKNLSGGQQVEKSKL